MTHNVSRRDFLAMSAKGAGAAVISYGLMGCGSEDTKIAGDFLHGVASGDPTQKEVILWTRVTPEYDGEVPVSWELATDDAFSELVQTGNMLTNIGRDYTVKVDAIQL
jgi:alkaline phosphatase D